MFHSRTVKLFFSKITLPLPQNLSQMNMPWSVDYKFMVWFKLWIYYGSFAFSPGEIYIFLFSLKAHNYYPAYHTEADFSNWKDLFWLKSPGILSSWKLFIMWSCNAMVCCAKEAHASIVLDIEWVQFVLQNCENLQNYRFK